MKKPLVRTLFRLTLISLLAAPLCHAGFWSTFFKHDVSVITDTDMTPEGAKRPRPSPGNPTYYLAVSLGFHDLGAAVAGDKIPAKEEMNKHIAKVLAKEGYLPATKKHPPSILLVWAWGTLYPDTFEDPSNPGRSVQLNRTAMMRFLGGGKMGMQTDPDVPSILPTGLQFFDADAQAIMDAASDDLYIAAIMALDYETFVKQKKKLYLWKTKISCPSRGLVLADTLPTMLNIAGPNIGVENKKPIWIDASEKYKGNVKIGDPVFEEFIDSGKLPVIDADKVTPKAPKPSK